ncbi:MAG TPA: DUF1569 domain-containing protein [Phycisphaerales bacterium]|nr:DUF1569 domain-containing protein [Phycisphaerales bacterium]
MIDTTKVQGRRAVRYATVADMIADARACVAARQLEQLGNWSVGRAMNHVAAWIEYPFVGYPPELVIPEEMKAQAKLVKTRLMQAAMQPGERLPGLEAGTLATEDVAAAVGLARLERAAAMPVSGGPDDPAPVPDPAFGVVTLHEWTEISLRHAELHMSFFVVRE